MRRGRGRGASGLRGATSLDATRVRMAARRARHDPPPQGRPGRGRGSPPGRSRTHLVPSPRVGAATARAGRRRGRGPADRRCRRAPHRHPVEGTPALRPVAASPAARRPGRDRLRSWRRGDDPASSRSAAGDRRRLPEPRARLRPQPSPGHGPRCSRATPAARSKGAWTPPRSGPTSARRSRPRWPGRSWARHMRTSATSTPLVWSGRAAQSAFAAFGAAGWADKLGR